MPSTSMAIQTFRPSTGSTVMLRTRGDPVFGQSSAIPTGRSSQRRPPSSERNSVAREWVPVPAYSTFGSAGFCAIAHTACSQSGESTSAQCAPRSSLRYSPRSVAAYDLRLVARHAH